MFTNSSAEYWRGDCSLTHIDILGEKDLDLDENIRIYLFSSTQHGAGVLPQSNSTGAAEVQLVYMVSMLLIMHHYLEHV